jgi:hypothetical protein
VFSIFFVVAYPVTTNPTFGREAALAGFAEPMTRYGFGR